MSNESSNAAGWSGRLIPPQVADGLPPRPDDPRLGELIRSWNGDVAEFTPGRAVLVGFPCDEGIRRNQGRVGAAQGPAEIRRWLYRLTPRDGASEVDLARVPPLDVGDVAGGATLEEAQALLGEIVGAILRTEAVPVVLGGGHEMAYGHFLGYVAAKKPVGIINLDAHLDVRPLLDGRGHSGSPFRQAIEHPSRILTGDRYRVLGAQPFSVSREQAHWLGEQGGSIWWCDEVRGRLRERFAHECTSLEETRCAVYVTLDADVGSAAEVPGVSAVNPTGLSGVELAQVARLAGATPAVASFDLVEVSPPHDIDGRSARWAAVAVWQFLAGLAGRG